MANRLFQRVRVRAVLHRQIHVDFGDVYIGHDAAHRELLGVGQGEGRMPPSVIVAPDSMVLYCCAASRCAVNSALSVSAMAAV